MQGMRERVRTLHRKKATSLAGPDATIFAMIQMFWVCLQGGAGPGSGGNRQHFRRTGRTAKRKHQGRAFVILLKCS
jgi:hypothetical protein